MVTLVFRSSLFFVGAVVGTVIGAKLYGVLAGSSNSVIVAVVFVAAVAFICGWMANRWHARVVLWVTAIGGAALTLTGLGRIWPDQMQALSNPQTPTQTASRRRGVGAAHAWPAGRPSVGYPRAGSSASADGRHPGQIGPRSVSDAPTPLRELRLQQGRMRA